MVLGDESAEKIEEAVAADKGGDNDGIDVADLIGEL